MARKLSSQSAMGGLFTRSSSSGMDASSCSAVSRAIRELPRNIAP
jgi:hypothetical protein